MIASIKKAQVVMGVPEGGEAQSIYLGSDPDKATKAYKDIASVGTHEKFSTLIWYGNGRLIKSCKIKILKKASTKKAEKTEKKESN